MDASADPRTDPALPSPLAPRNFRGEIHAAVADEKVHDMRLARPSGLFTKNPIGIEFSEADDRKKAAHFGRWVSRRGDVGPWSMPVCMTIAA